MNLTSLERCHQYGRYVDGHSVGAGSARGGRKATSETVIKANSETRNMTISQKKASTCQTVQRPIWNRITVGAGGTSEIGPRSGNGTTGIGKRVARLVPLVAWLVALVAMAAPAQAATGTISPSPFQLILDSNGNPVNAGCIWTYTAGTSTPVATYTDVALSVANTNPIIASSAGRFTAFLTPGQSYKFIYENIPCTSISHGTVLVTADNIAATPTASNNVDVTGTAGEAITAGQCVYLSNGSGSKTQGQWYKCDTTNTYSSTLPTIGLAPSAISATNVGTIRITGSVTGLSSLSVGSDYYASTAGSLTSTAPTNYRLLGRADSATSLVLNVSPYIPPTTIGDCNGRLTLTTAVPVTKSDVTAATTLFWTPYKGNRCALYDGTLWTLRTMTEISIAVPATTSTNYDVWLFDNSGTLTLELLAWRNSGQAVTGATTATPIVITSNAHGLSNGDEVYVSGVQGNTPANGTWTVANVTANTYELATSVGAGAYTAATGYMQARVGTTKLTTQDGVYVKLTATTRRYIGNMRTTTVSGQTEDSLTKRYVWNYYNRVRRELRRLTTDASWNYTLATIRQANANAANQVDVIVGVEEAALHVDLLALFDNTNASVQVSVFVGEDSTTTADLKMVGGVASSQIASAGTYNNALAMLRKTAPPGRHFYSWNEYSQPAGTTQWWGGTSGGWAGGVAPSGMSGWIEG